jgi:hypothetical protein
LREPRPIVVDCKFAELMYPEVCIVCRIPCVVDVKEYDDIYADEPRPVVVDCKFAELMYSEVCIVCRIPCVVDVKEVVEM